jgi:hypothetical protein
MLIVAPNGREKEYTSFLLPIFSADSMVTGKVPLELLVTNAVKKASFPSLINRLILRPP